MKNAFIYFLILHYGSETVTEECVESILKLLSIDDIRIVIVDNASKNGSYESLVKRYESCDKIVLLHLDEEKGFSYGNNYGYQYIRGRRDAKFIVVCNNDIVFLQNDFVKRLKDLYAATQFYVMGPDIFNTSKKYHQNPYKYEIANVCKVERAINDVKFELEHLSMMIIKDYIIDAISKIKIVSKLRSYKHKFEDKQLEDICIHGSCIILSELFVNQVQLVFNPATLFYCEEEILSYRCHKNKWKILYNPLIKVEHRESKATIQKYSNYRARREFMLNNTLDSLIILKNYINENCD